HRDIKLSNILLALSGRVQLIDFSISWKEEEDLDAKKNDLRSRPYRAPELLFGPRS
ncbi:hypothetical protein K503DRAFT_647371, partial [Rhizopogon vinicolor AM-OR11-026]